MRRRGIALTAALAVLATLTATELTLRRFAPLYTVGISDAYQYDPDLGYRLKPDIHILKTTDHQEEVWTNALGTVNLGESFQDYRTLVFALGDSYTQGTGLPGDAAYPFQLDLILNRDASGLYTKRYAVVNLGLAAFGGEQSLIALRRYASLIGKPAVILYLGAENDYADDQLFQSGYRHGHFVDGNPRWGWLLGPVRWVADTELGKRARLARASGTRGGRPRDGDVRVPSVAELERPVFERLAAASREYDAMLVMSWAEAPSVSYDWLKAWAAGKGIAFADWLPAVESVRAGIPKTPVLNSHSGGHLRGWVMRVIAEEYARQIEIRRR